MERAGRRPHRLRRRRRCSARQGRPRRRVVLWPSDPHRRSGKMGESGRQRQPGVRLGRGGGAGTPGAGYGLPDRVRQPGVGMLQQGERHLRLQAGRPHQLVLLPGHRGRQLCRDRGQRRPLYRCGHLHGLCAVLQGKHPAQALRFQALGFPAQLPALPGRGQKRGPQSLRAERDAVLSLARRRDGVGRQHPGQGVGGAGCRAACQCEAGCGRCAGWPVLSACQPGKRGASAGL